MQTRILDLLVVNRFIWWFLLLFYLEFKLEEQWFHACRSQWDIWVSSRKAVFFGFSMLIINEGKICDIRSTKICNCKTFVQVSITFSNLRLANSCFSRPRFRYCDFFMLLFLNTSILDLLWMKTYIWYFCYLLSYPFRF